MTLAVAAVAVAVAVAWVVVTAVVWLAAHWALVVGVIAALGVALLLLARSGVAGIHCPGCGHR